MKIFFWIQKLLWRDVDDQLVGPISILKNKEVSLFLIFNTILPLSDIGTDLYTSIDLFLNEQVNWSLLTIVWMCMPFLMKCIIFFYDIISIWCSKKRLTREDIKDKEVIQKNVDIKDKEVIKQEEDIKQEGDIKDKDDIKKEGDIKEEKDINEEKDIKEVEDINDKGDIKKKLFELLLHFPLFLPFRCLWNVGKLCQFGWGTEKFVKSKSKDVQWKKCSHSRIGGSLFGSL